MRKRSKTIRWIKWIAAMVVLIILAVVLGLPRLNDFEREGRLVLPSLKGEVRVVRDEKGMAYILAADENDLIRAQGFVTAQDRLFPMQLTRLFSTGRIAELAGEKGKKSDILMRTIGFGRQANVCKYFLTRWLQDTRMTGSSLCLTALVGIKTDRS